MSSFYVAVLVALCYTSVVTSEEDDDNAVLHYNQELFDSNVPQTPHFIKFYAPWCGHCKRLVPTWEELSNKYNVDGSSITVAKVDCTVHTSLCSAQGVTGYPTLKFFQPDGGDSVKYTGQRNLESFVTFINEQLDIISSVTEDEAAPEEGDAAPFPESGVRVLTEATFAAQVAGGRHFVKFFAPWCGHCKSLAPVWKQLGETFSAGEGVTISEVDCTENRPVCSDLEVRGYPTLLWIVNGKKVDTYKGARSHEALEAYVQKMADEEVEEVADDERDKVPDAVEEVVVLSLNEETFDEAIKEGATFVKFFTPWCGHCKSLAPAWLQLAEAFAGNKVTTIAEVDCSNQGALCQRSGVDGYPTIKLYRNGQMIAEFEGARDLDSLKSFLKDNEPHDEL